MPGNPCLGFEVLGLCAYDPSNPHLVYFSLGEAIAALAFTLAVQQLLKPVYRFRLSARYLSLSKLYGLVFLGLLAVSIAALLPSLPVPRSNPLAYPLLWNSSAQFCSQPDTRRSHLQSFDPFARGRKTPLSLQGRQPLCFRRRQLRIMSSISGT
jgi:hypothetical protein